MSTGHSSCEREPSKLDGKQRSCWPAAEVHESKGGFLPLMLKERASMPQRPLPAAGRLKHAFDSEAAGQSLCSCGHLCLSRQHLHGLRVMLSAWSSLPLFIARIEQQGLLLLRWLMMTLRMLSAGSTG